jgi:pimeloyl-ACP methyl ester carboxylesterase
MLVVGLLVGGVLFSLTLSSTLSLSARPLNRGQSIPRVDESGYVKVGSDSLFYETVGHGLTLVLIHDGMVHREIWDHQLSSFSQHFEVVRYDRRGYGKSTPPTEPFSNVEDLNRLFETLGIEQAGLVAMSSGGRLAIDFTLQNPGKVSSLVLVGAVVDGFPYTQHFFDRGGHLPPDLSNAQRRAYYATDDPYEIYSENAAAREQVLDLLRRSPMQDNHSFSSPRPDPPATARLQEIEAPTLILVGEFDIPDVHAHSGAINLGVRHSTRDIIPRAGHLIPIEQPDLFNERVLEFLTSLDR